MAEYGEWNRKGAVLSDVTAAKEFGIAREFIVKGINAGKLEYREGVIWGNPYLRILRSQLETYIAEKLGSEYLETRKARSELGKINKEMAEIEKRMNELEKRKAEIQLQFGGKRSKSKPR